MNKFKNFKLPKSKLDTEIDRLIDKMSQLDPSSEAYGIIVNNLVGLHEAKNKNAKAFVDPELLGIFVSFAEILVVLNHEKLDIIASKAFGMVKRL